MCQQFGLRFAKSLIILLLLFDAPDDLIVGLVEIHAGAQSFRQERLLLMIDLGFCGVLIFTLISIVNRFKDLFIVFLRKDESLLLILLMRGL